MNHNHRLDHCNHCRWSLCFCVWSTHFHALHLVLSCVYWQHLLHVKCWPFPIAIIKLLARIWYSRHITLFFFISWDINLKKKLQWKSKGILSVSHYSHQISWVSSPHTAVLVTKLTILHVFVYFHVHDLFCCSQILHNNHPNQLSQHVDLNHACSCNKHNI